MFGTKHFIGLLLIAAIFGSLVAPAMAYTRVERLYDPVTGTYRTVSTTYSSYGSYDPYYGSYTTNRGQPYYSSSYASPYGYGDSGYRSTGYAAPYAYSDPYYADDYGYRSRRRSIAPALIGAGIGYAIGHSRRW